MEFNKKINIAVDFDDLLTFMTPLWVQLIHINKNYFGRYFNLIENYDYNNPEFQALILLREEYPLANMFWKEDLNISDNERKEVINNMNSLLNNSNFYQCCIPSDMCKDIIELCKSSYVEKLFIITKNCFTKQLESKKIFIDKYFKNSLNKISLIDIDNESKKEKSDVLKELHTKIDVFMDDCLYNVTDVINNYNNDNNIGMDIYMPSLGYNAFKTAEDYKSFVQNAQDKYKTITYYKVFKD